MRWTWLLVLPALALAAAAPAARAPRAMRLEPLWTLKGAYWGVAVSGGQIYASSGERPLWSLDRITPVGVVEARMPQQGSLLLQPLRPERPQQLLIGFWTWSRVVLAVDALGRTSELAQAAQGINDVMPFDADRDGDDELIVGHNGGEGVWLVERSGEVRWRNRDIGNAWNVSGALLDGQPRIVHVEASGGLSVLDSSGVRVAHHTLPFYAVGVRAAGSDRLVMSGTRGNDTTTVAACDGAGRIVWSRDLLTGRGATLRMAVEPASSFVAVGAVDGGLWVLDALDGSVVATRPSTPGIWELAWLADGAAGPPVLLVAGKKGLTAHRVGR